MLYWNIDRNNIIKKGRIAGNFNGRYWNVCINRKRIQVHHVIWIMHGNKIPLDKNFVIDHINRNSYDNRIENLRLITLSENVKNSSWCDSAQYISYDKKRKSSKKWRARPHKKHLGWFETKEQAEYCVNKYLNSISQQNKQLQSA